MAEETYQRRQSDVRLDNIEKSITRIDTSLMELSSAMISLARVEERLASSGDKVNRLEQEVAELRKIVRAQAEAASEASKDSATEHERARWLERILWTLITGGAIGASYMGFIPQHP